MQNADNFNLRIFYLLKDMTKQQYTAFLLALLTVLAGTAVVTGQDKAYPDAAKNPQSTLMLAGSWVPGDPHKIDFQSLPAVKGEHAIVSDVRYAWGMKVHQHNYITFYDGLYWIMWSDGPGIQREGVSAKEHRGVVPGHDRAGQLISYSTSPDGLNWSEPRDLAGPPDDGFGWIARGFWIYNGELLALATRYQAPSYRGDGLQLHAFRRVKGGKKEWQHRGLVYDNAMNNFAPKQIPTGEWMMSRRDKDANVHMMIGGVNGFDKWESFPVISYSGEELAAEEPYWWVLPDGNLVAFFRDNKKSGYLFRAFSTDNGRTWSRPVKTNFPDAGSKFSGLRLKDGRYVLVSNSHPAKRDPLTIAVSDDGLVFNKLFYVAGGRHVDYPHVYEHDGQLFIAFAGAKQTVEVIKVGINDLSALTMPSK
ncbi:MAG: hypothetical protein ABS46_06225 [Cytophagaceae bacterium SCN 52-12]|nr:MAG: hypothetical protein ABS46_06225 [Cytophagaceae bacterium SCN 52-12]